MIVALLIGTTHLSGENDGVIGGEGWDAVTSTKVPGTYGIGLYSLFQKFGMRFSTSSSV